MTRLSARIRPRLSYANVTATLALVVALAGTSYAAVTITGENVRDGSLTGADLKNGSVGPADLASSIPKAAVAVQTAKKKKKRGPPGPQGQPGPPGPTQGAAFSNFTGSFPLSAPEQDAQQGTITTTTSGRLFVFGRGLLGLSCTSGEAEVGLYVDGTPVPLSGQPHPGNGTPTLINIFGISASVPAGSHTIKMSDDCSTGDFTGGSDAQGAVGAILLGG